jgi:hypothetical protein
VKGHIALDDIRYVQCAVSDECTFAVDTCFWNNAQSNQLQWQLNRLPGKLLGNTLVSNISYVLSSSPWLPTKFRAYLDGPLISESDDLCYLRISYSYPDLSKSTLGLSHCQSNCQSNEDDHITLQKSLTKQYFETGIIPGDHRLSWFTIVYASWRPFEAGEFIIHSLQYLRCHCTTFESDVYWHDVSPSVSSTWSVVNASDNVIPSFDHTYGKQLQQKGKYSLASGRDNQHAVGTTTSVILWENVCGLRFWYYVSQGTPHLQFVVVNGSVNSSKVVWERGYEVTKDWMLAEMAVGFELYGLRIEVNASSMDGTAFSVAVDDIEFTECADFQPCSFEKDLCLWRIADDLSTNATWIRWKGTSPALNSTLQADHTRRTPLGRYLLMLAISEASVMSSNYSAFLQGLPIGAESGVCGIEFWYHINTLSSVTLTVSLESEFDHRVIWQYDGQHTVDWIRARENFTVYTASHVQFMATSPDLSSSTVAIDDVTYLECSGHSLSFPSTATPFTVSTQFSWTHPSSPKKTTVSTDAQKTPSIGLIPTHPTSQSTDSTTVETYSSDVQVKTSTNPTSISKSSSSDSVSVAAVAGGAVGGIFIIIVAAVVVFLVIWLNKNSKKDNPNNNYILAELDREQSLKLQSNRQGNIYSEVDDQFEGVTADPLNSNPRAFSNTSTFDQNVYSSISNNNGAFSGTTTFDENLYASIGKNNGEIDRSGKAAENILYESSDKVLDLVFWL